MNLNDNGKAKSLKRQNWSNMTTKRTTSQLLEFKKRFIIAILSSLPMLSSSHKTLSYKHKMHLSKYILCIVVFPRNSKRAK